MHFNLALKSIYLFTQHPVAVVSADSGNKESVPGKTP